MDETELINVTKKAKYFMDVKLMERSESKLFIPRNLKGMPPPDEKMPWVITLIDSSSIGAI